MDLSTYVVDALHEDAALVACVGAATERVRARVYSHASEREEPRLHSEIGGSRVAPASRRVIGTEAS